MLTGSRTVASLATLLLGMFLASCVPPAAGQPSPTPMPSLPTDTRPPTAGPVADTATSVPPTGTPPPAEETAVVATWASSPADLSVIGPDNASDLQVLARLEGSLAFSPDLATFALKKKAGIALVEAQTLAEIALLPCEDSDRCDVFAFSPHGETLAWNPQAGVVRVWDVAARTMRAELGDLPETCCRELSYSPDGRLLAISTWPPVSLWDAATARELFSLDNAWQVFFAPDGKTLAFSLLNATAVVLWDIDSNQEIRTLTGFERASPVAPGYGALFSPDWRNLLWVSARVGAQLMDVGTGRFGPEFEVSDAEFSPDGRVLAATEHGWVETPCTAGVCLFSVPGGGLLSTLEHDDSVYAMDFSPDGRLLATYDGNVHLWDVALGRRLITLEGWYLDFSPDGRLLAVNDGDPGTSLWGVP